ncbi:MAG TPA: response regulator transcription factor [Gemmatimonadaceae bacterium]|nr:response regulator transcription factor [Gemmatimonadaceae bacterium]
MRLLLIEDDPALSSVLESGLTNHGYQTEVAGSFASGRTQALAGAFDAIILDVMLPGGSGFELCRQLRQRKVTTPILILTARDSVDDRVTGLEGGADDYLTKPFALRELIARLRALGRRHTSALAQPVRVADLLIDLAAHRVRRGGRTVELTAKEFALLEVLVLNRDAVVTRAAITAHVWDEHHDPFANVVEVLVKRLRRKIDDGFEPKLIHTLRGSGYRLGV